MDCTLPNICGFPGGSYGKNLPLPLNAGDLNLIHGWWRREWLPILAFFPGEFHEQRSLVGYSPRVAKSQTQVSNWYFCLIFTWLILWCFSSLCWNFFFLKPILTTLCSISNSNTTTFFIFWYSFILCFLFYRTYFLIHILIWFWCLLSVNPTRN